MISPLRGLRRQAHASLPEGTLAVGVGLIVAGLTAYGYLVLSARALGPARYAPLSVLWALVVLAGPGCFLPLEQELARALAARRARGVHGGAVVRRAAILGAGLVGVLAVALLLSAGVMLERFFEDQVALLVSLALALAGYCAMHLLRGALAGYGKFPSYGLLVGAEGVVRLTLCVILFSLGVAIAGPYGLAIAVAPLAATALVAAKEGHFAPRGPEAPWGELSSALGWLLAGSVLAQGLLNAPPVAVKLLAAESQEAAAGRFLAGVVLARVPLFLFQAVQASVLPKLAGLAGAPRGAAFHNALKRLLLVVVAVALVATAGALTIGPWLLRLFFGEGFDLGRGDLGYLAGASGAFMVALVLAQALIALARYRAVVAGWFAGIAVFVVVAAAGSGLLQRVEQAFLAGAGAAAVVMAALMLSHLRDRVPAATEPVIATASAEMIEM